MSFVKLLVCICLITISFAGSSALYANNLIDDHKTPLSNESNYAKNKIIQIKSDISRLQYKIKLAIEEKNRNNSELASLNNNIRPYKYLTPLYYNTKNHHRNYIKTMRRPNNLYYNANKRQQTNKLKSQNLYLTKRIKQYQSKISKLNDQLAYWGNKIA